MTFQRFSLSPLGWSPNSSAHWLLLPSPVFSSPLKYCSWVYWTICSSQNTPCFMFGGHFSFCLLCLEVFLFLPGITESLMIQLKGCFPRPPQAWMLIPSFLPFVISSFTFVIRPGTLKCHCEVKIRTMSHSSSFFFCKMLFLLYYLLCSIFLNFLFCIGR